MQNIEIRTSKDGVDYQRVVDILERQGLSHGIGKEQMELAFRRSYAVAFAYDGDQLIGTGRALSDGISQAAIYNIALEDEYRGQEIGRRIIESLIAQVPGCTVILYTHPRTVAMYEHLGFRRFKTAMRYAGDDPEEIAFMEEHGFLLPEHYRFGDNEYENIPFDPKVRIPLDHV